MNTSNLNRWSTLPLKGTKKILNRVVIPPMASQTADQGGFVTQQALDHYERLAAAKAGLLIVEYTFVDLSGRSEENQLGIASDAHLDGLTTLAGLIKKSGSIAGIQLNHGGGKSERVLTGGPLMAPSAVPVPVKDRTLETPDPMTLEDIQLWRSAFVQAANRAVHAGFDLVEIHSAHGYGLNQWLSPIANRRNDEYGQTLQGRMTLLLEIVREIRVRHPALLISVRIPGQDFLEEGMSISDSIQLAQELERAGVDLIHVSSGIGGWRRPSPRIGEGYLVAEAAQIQAQVSVPVIGVGGIETGSFIDRGLQEGWFSLAAVGRAILKNPKDWSEKQLYSAFDLKKESMTFFKCEGTCW